MCLASLFLWYCVFIHTCRTLPCLLTLLLMKIYNLNYAKFELHLPSVNLSMCKKRRDCIDILKILDICKHVKNSYCLTTLHCNNCMVTPVIPGERWYSGLALG